MSPQRIIDLHPRHRRRAVARTAVVVVASWAILLGVYYLVPIGKDTGLQAIGRLSAGVVLVGVVIWRQTLRILRAELPELRAVEALGVVLPLFLVLFAVLYLALSHSARTTFSEPLDHTRALYFTITVFSTVGFGDITPRTDAARLIVSAQMLLDLVFLGVVVRTLFTAARFGLGRAEAVGSEPAD